MININGKDWQLLTAEDIKAFLTSPETEESFFIEFKDDLVGNKKLTEEISAFANSFGGYIFLGVSDSKEIIGCNAWNEQRIHALIHDSITPTPSFDIKKFTFTEETVFIIKIDEGSEPPYITVQGKIFERLSSGSFPVNDSYKLSQMYNKHEQRLQKIEKKISLDPLPQNAVNNIYGYIDIGFSLTLSNPQMAFQLFSNADLDSIAKEEKKHFFSFNLFRLGNSVTYSPGGLSSKATTLPAHINNFIEIMADGSTRMRVLLSNNDPEDPTVNMIYPLHFIDSFREIYSRIMGDLFPSQFIYAKKYEALNVLKQFHPIFMYTSEMELQNPPIKSENERIVSYIREKRKVFGVDTVFTSMRIPMSGLYTIDKQMMQKIGINEYSASSIIQELFHSGFVDMSFPFDIYKQQ